MYDTKCKYSFIFFKMCYFILNFGIVKKSLQKDYKKRASYNDKKSTSSILISITQFI